MTFQFLEKVRVVFNSSCRTGAGVCKGMCIQQLGQHISSITERNCAHTEQHISCSTEPQKR
jgi:hypothetical protein